jgi:hypothetical protein
VLRLSGLCHPLQALPLHSGGTQADATDALDFAEWAVDNAQLAMLDAIDARAYADDLRTQQPHCRGDYLV